MPFASFSVSQSWSDYDLQSHDSPIKLFLLYVTNISGHYELIRIDSNDPVVSKVIQPILTRLNWQIIYDI